MDYILKSLAKFFLFAAISLAVLGVVFFVFWGVVAYIVVYSFPMITPIADWTGSDLYLAAYQSVDQFYTPLIGMFTEKATVEGFTSTAGVVATNATVWVDYALPISFLIIMFIVFFAIWSKARNNMKNGQNTLDSWIGAFGALTEAGTLVTIFSVIVLGVVLTTLRDISLQELVQLPDFWIVLAAIVVLIFLYLVLWPLIKNVAKNLRDLLENVFQGAMASVLLLVATTILLSIFAPQVFQQVVPNFPVWAQGLLYALIGVGSGLDPRMGTLVAVVIFVAAIVMFSKAGKSSNSAPAGMPPFLQMGKK